MTCYSTPLVKDVITGETFGDIRQGTLQEKRLLSSINESGTKIYFGPLDSYDLQCARAVSYFNRTSITPRKRDKKMRVVEIGENEPWPN